MLVTFQIHLRSNVKLSVTVILSLYALNRTKFFQLKHLSYVTVVFILFTVLSYPSHLRLAVLKPMALVCIYALNRKKHAKLNLPSTFQTSDIELLNQKMKLNIHLTKSPKCDHIYQFAFIHARRT